MTKKRDPVPQAPEETALPSASDSPGKPRVTHAVRAGGVTIIGPAAAPSEETGK
jgi:hypothetical protein